MNQLWCYRTGSNDYFFARWWSGPSNAADSEYKFYGTGWAYADGGWGTPANDYAEVAVDSQIIENDYVVDFEHPTHGPVKLVGSPVHLSKTPAEIRMPAPEFGQHTEEVLLELGYSWEEIGKLNGEEVI